MSAARDIEARALEDTAQTAEKYAFVCALGDWDIPEEARCGLTRAQLANVTHPSSTMCEGSPSTRLSTRAA